MKREIELVDVEWVKLMLAARDLGLTPEEVRIFLAEASKQGEVSEA